MALTNISLFTGIAGIELAAEWAGFKTILMVENDAYCQKVLKKHWPGVPIIGDIKDVTKERIEALTKWHRENPGWQATLTREELVLMAYTPSREPGEQKARNGGQDTGGGSEEAVARNSKGNSINKVRGISERENSKSRGIGDDGTDRRPRDKTHSPVTLVTGGFPCQPVSGAGLRRGKEDDRWLWPEMLRVISEVRPTWVVAENVAGLLTMGFNDCISDLEGEGYETTSFLIPACAVNAPHRRDRIFIVGYAKSEYGDGFKDNARDSQRPQEIPELGNPSRETDVGNPKCDGHKDGHSEAGGEVRRSEQGGVCQSEGASQDVANTLRERQEHIGEGDKGSKRRPGRDTPGRSRDVADTQAICPGHGHDGNVKTLRPTKDGRKAWGGISGSEWWAVEPDVGRVAYGIPSRVDRLKCLGNAVVPQQIYPILKAIATIELQRA